VSLQPVATFPSPLRYPGGKRKVINFMKLLFLENGLVGSDYLEPYAGGASVALALLYDDYVDHVHINDLDDSVFGFWQAVLTDADTLCARIQDTRLTMDEWHRQRAVQADTSAQPLDLAFSTFFLNRTNRSGIITGGVIGGQDQTGKWKLDARFNKGHLIQRIQKVARFRSRITLTRLDAADLLLDWLDTEQTGFVYLDPPYYVKGEGLYTNFYEHAHHEVIADLVRRLSCRWVVSYDEVPEILVFFTGYSTLPYTLSYSAADRYRGDEVMFFSSGLRLPEAESPSCVPTSEVERARRRAS